ncbi:MAG: hypothetical protein N2Z62_00235 [Rhodobacteraceae bacterium]|nr:hypothetical protein [Paracoccaceae bacterium]
MKHIIAVTALLSLAACVDQSSQIQRGVGFGDYTLYQQQQAYLARARAMASAPQQPAPLPVQTAAAAPAPGAVPLAPVATAPLPAAPASAAAAPATIGSETLAVLGASPAPAAAAAAPAPAPSYATAAAPLSAVEPQSIAPTAAATLPNAPAAAEFDGANIVAFALATTHPVGQQMYRRTNLFGTARTERACARYPSPGLAQEAFLSRGGPERDPLGLDPDGDGYVCGWDPAPFRNFRS